VQEIPVDQARRKTVQEFLHGIPHFECVKAAAADAAHNVSEDRAIEPLASRSDRYGH
jgi:hypothetical protein